MEIELVQGDICKEKADVIVNAAGTNLYMGGGVAGALKRAGGEEIEREALKKAPAKLGEVIVTGAGKLNAKYVFHAAAQPHYGNYKATEESVRDALRKALRKAEAFGCESIAIPAIGCGIAGLEVEKGARVILEELKNFKGKYLWFARVVLFSVGDYSVFERELKELGNDGPWEYEEKIA